MSDFRVHAHIFDTLKRTANGEGCEICQQNAAFQLALCSSIEFGAVYVENERDEWIRKSGKSMSELQETLSRIKTENARANVAAGLYKMGYRSNLLDRYRGDNLMHEATGKYQSMVSRREKVLGAGHHSTLRLKSILVSLLSWTGRFKEALPYALSNVENASPDIGNRDFLTLRGQVADLYTSLGKHEDAQAIQNEIEMGYGLDPEDQDHPSRLYNSVCLARGLMISGESKKALDISMAVEKQALEMLGQYHPTSASAKRVVMEALDATGQLEIAVEVHESLICVVERTLTADHGLLVEDLAVLGVQYYRLGKVDAAAACYNKVMASVDKKPENASAAVISINNYATRILRHCSVAEGTTILHHLLKEAERVLGPDQEDVVGVMGNLAAGYQKQQKWADAEALERRVLARRRASLGDDHHHTLSAFRNLSRNLIHQRRWADAATVLREELNIIDAANETTPDARITVLSTLSRVLAASRAYSDAAAAFDRLLPLVEQQTSDTADVNAVPSVHVADIALAALCEARMGQSRRTTTRQRLQTLFAALQRPWREIPAIIIVRLTTLAKVCDDYGWDDETEQVLAAGKLIGDKYAEKLEPDMLQRLDAMAQSFLRRSGRQELSFFPDVLAVPIHSE
jgi:tetratricopeptide (TPR) repeat protein